MTYKLNWAACDTMAQQLYILVMFTDVIMYISHDNKEFQSVDQLKSVCVSLLFGQISSNPWWQVLVILTTLPNQVDITVIRLGNNYCKN